MKKKLCLVIIIFTSLAILTGIPYLMKGIHEKGFACVNYGRIIFPLILCAASCFIYKKQD